MFSPYDYYVTPDEYEEAMRQGIPRVRVDERIRKLGWGKREAIGSFGNNEVGKSSWHFL